MAEPDEADTERPERDFGAEAPCRRREAVKSREDVSVSVRPAWKRGLIAASPPVY